MFVVRLTDGSLQELAEHEIDGEPHHGPKEAGKGTWYETKEEAYWAACSWCEQLGLPLDSVELCQGTLWHIWSRCGELWVEAEEKDEALRIWCKQAQGSDDELVSIEIVSWSKLPKDTEVITEAHV